MSSTTHCHHHHRCHHQCHHCYCHRHHHRCHLHHCHRYRHQFRRHHHRHQGEKELHLRDRVLPVCKKETAKTTEDDKKEQDVLIMKHCKKINF